MSGGGSLTDAVSTAGALFAEGRLAVAEGRLSDAVQAFAAVKKLSQRIQREVDASHRQRMLRGMDASASGDDSGLAVVEELSAELRSAVSTVVRARSEGSLTDSALGELWGIAAELGDAPDDPIASDLSSAFASRACDGFRGDAMEVRRQLDAARAAAGSFEASESSHSTTAAVVHLLTAASGWLSQLSSLAVPQRARAQVIHSLHKEVCLHLDPIISAWKTIRDVKASIDKARGVGNSSAGLSSKTRDPLMQKMLALIHRASTSRAHTASRAGPGWFPLLLARALSGELGDLFESALASMESEGHLNEALCAALGCSREVLGSLDDANEEIVFVLSTVNAYTHLVGAALSMSASLTSVLRAGGKVSDIVVELASSSAELERSISVLQIRRSLLLAKPAVTIPTLSSTWDTLAGSSAPHEFWTNRAPVSAWSWVDEALWTCHRAVSRSCSSGVELSTTIVLNDICHSIEDLLLAEAWRLAGDANERCDPETAEAVGFGAGHPLARALMDQLREPSRSRPRQVSDETLARQGIACELPFSRGVFGVMERRAGLAVNSTVEFSTMMLDWARRTAEELSETYPESSDAAVDETASESDTVVLSLVGAHAGAQEWGELGGETAVSDSGYHKAVETAFQRESSAFSGRVIASLGPCIDRTFAVASTAVAAARATALTFGSAMVGKCAAVQQAAATAVARGSYSPREKEFEDTLAALASSTTAPTLPVRAVVTVLAASGIAHACSALNPRARPAVAAAVTRQIGFAWERGLMATPPVLSSHAASISGVIDGLIKSTRSGDPASAASSRAGGFTELGGLLLDSELQQASDFLENALLGPLTEEEEDLHRARGVVEIRRGLARLRTLANVLSTTRIGEAVLVATTASIPRTMWIPLLSMRKDFSKTAIEELVAS
jgi:hypothetical protein